MNQEPYDVILDILLALPVETRPHYVSNCENFNIDELWNDLLVVASEFLLDGG